MIPVSIPVFGEDEIANVTDALRKGEISGNFGSYLGRFESEFAARMGCRHGVATTSGTTALHLAVAVLGIGPGDEVLVSSSTNIATALAVHHNGALTVPVDCEDVTWNMDLDQLERLITPRTRAIIPVHLFGHPVDMDRLMDIARRHDLAVIEDCAESHGATVRGKVTGSLGDMGCFSFYSNKIITTGEGGMVTTNDDDLAEKLRSMRNLAFGQPRFLHQVAAFNFRMTSYQAAFGLAQLTRLEDIIAAKRTMAARYTAHLTEIPGILCPREMDWAHHVYWMYAVCIDPEAFGMPRDQLCAALDARGIQTRTFFCPMNQQPFLRETPGFAGGPLPVADRLWETGFYLPSTHTLTPEDIAHICTAISDIRTGK